MTNRIYLRPLEPADITDEYASWFKNSDGYLDHFSGSGFEPDRALLLDELEGSSVNGLVHYYAVVFAETEAVIGSVKIGPISKRHGTADLVTLIGARELAGLGLGSEAVREGTRVAFTQLGVRKLHGGMYAANQASIAAYTAAGWLIEGTLCDHYLVDGVPMDRVLVACFNPAAANLLA